MVAEKFEFVFHFSENLRGFNLLYIFCDSSQFSMM